MTAAPYAAFRARYVEDSLATASPAKLLTMLYDRLVLDLDRAVAGLQVGNVAGARQQLQHAQDIVFELRGMLTHGEWAGAAALDGLYGFLISQLVRASIGSDAEAVASCRTLVEPLREAWHEAARTVATNAAAVAPSLATA